MRRSGIPTGAPRAAAALALLALHAAPEAARAQDRACDGGRGVVVADLGIEPLPRSASVDPSTDEVEVRFDPDVRIAGVRPDGPAAGRLREGDVLVALDGHRITTRDAARRYAELRPGERVRLSVRRGVRSEEVTITAAAQCAPHPPAPPAPPHAAAPPDAPPPPIPPSDELMPEARLGFTLECRNCGRDTRGVFRFREPPVVATVRPGSPAAVAGLRPGDRLTHVDGAALTGPAGWQRLRGIRPGQDVLLTWERGDRVHRATIEAAQRPGPTARQERRRPMRREPFGRLHVAPFAGAIRFTELAEVQGATAQPDPGAPPERVVNMDIRARPAPVLGLAIGAALSRALDLRLRYGFAATDFDMSGVSTTTGGSLGAVETVGGLGDVFVNLLGVDLTWRLRGPRARVAPYAVLGAGVAFWDLNDLGDFQVLQPVTGVAFDVGPRTATTFSGTLGLGAELRFGSGAALRLELADQLGTSPLGTRDFSNPAPDFFTTADVASVVHAVSLSAGVVIRAPRPRR